MAETRAGYKQAIAANFDARTDYRHSTHHPPLADRLLRIADPRPGERVLDLATGTGFVAVPAARAVGERGRVVGVDLSAGMLAQAAEAVAAAGLTNVELVRGDAETVDLPAGTFDLVVCASALPYMADVPAALRRWRGLLRPGGRLAFNCWSDPSYATGRLFREVAARHGIRVAAIGADTGSPDRCRAVLSAAGFARAEVVAEPTRDYFQAELLAAMPESAPKNPLFDISPIDVARLSGLRDEYAAESRSATTLRGIEAEVGAYFALGYAP